MNRLEKQRVKKGESAMSELCCEILISRLHKLSL